MVSARACSANQASPAAMTGDASIQKRKVPFSIV